MGDKTSARASAPARPACIVVSRQRWVPVDIAEKEALKVAKKIGFPVMIKAP